MGSDDTEHSIMLAQALLVSGGEVSRFTRAFASELRWWLLGLPAGVGLATARAIIRLWLGFPPQKSGVFSAGNGPCMRTAIIGVVFRDDLSKRKCFTEAQTIITHRDPKALIATEAVAELAALLSGRSEPPKFEEVMSCLLSEITDPEWIEILERLDEHHHAGSNFSEFLSSIGGDPDKGVSGYAYHTVPAVVFVGLRHEWDFRDTVSAILNAGGDADTTGAIAGALCGAFGGESSIPREWVEGIWEWPVTVAKIRDLGKALEEGRELRIRPRWSPILLVRNLVFLAIVLGHGFGRVRHWFLR